MAFEPQRAHRIGDRFLSADTERKAADVDVPEPVPALQL
jgi:hypothetical protein